MQLTPVPPEPEFEFSPWIPTISHLITICPSFTPTAQDKLFSREPKFEGDGSFQELDICQILPALATGLLVLSSITPLSPASPTAPSEEIWTAYSRLSPKLGRVDRSHPRPASKRPEPADSRPGPPPNPGPVTRPTPPPPQQSQFWSRSWS